MSTGATAGGQGVVMHVRCPDRLPEETYRHVLEELSNLSPVVQALPPTAALVDLRGALPYYGVEARRLGEVLRIRTLSRLGVDVRVGIGPSRSRQVRGFLKASDRELAGHLRSRRRSCSRLRQQGLVRPALGRAAFQCPRVLGLVLDRDDLFLRVVGDDQEHLVCGLVQVGSGGEGAAVADVGEGEGRLAGGVLEAVTGRAQWAARVLVA
ncbi:hypothetical protein ABZ307_39900 [Streptomyces griseorubiginosus]